MLVYELRLIIFVNMYKSLIKFFLCIYVFYVFWGKFIHEKKRNDSHSKNKILSIVKKKSIRKLRK